MSDTNSSNPLIIDLTDGISASTSPMMSPFSRSRSVSREAELSASRSDENENDVSLTLSRTFRKPRAAHAKKRVLDNDDDDDDGDDGDVNDEKNMNVKEEVTEDLSTHQSNPLATKLEMLMGEAETNANRSKVDNSKTQSSHSVSASSTGSTSKLEKDYLKARINGVKKRSFDLNRIPTEEIIPTGRTIKRMSAWNGHWPALREFMQNTIDHLGLLDSKTGRLHKALRLHITAGQERGELAIFQFLCGQEPVCSITASRDELVIDQLYTFPIAPRALDTGVPDTEKSSSTSAGGFGDGFKTAAVALLALGTKDFESLEWHFFAEGHFIQWSFEGANRAAVGTFANCQVLQVCISRKAENSMPSGDGPVLQENTMRQVISVRNIGKSFIEQAVPRLAVFWDLDHSTLVSSSQRGCDFIGPASVQPAIASDVLGPSIKPESGVYVKGIWVRKAKIAGTLMCFFGRRLEVNGRDRNDCDDDELISALAYVFRHCSNSGYLRQLLAPLKGRGAVVETEAHVESSSSSSSTSRPKGGSRQHSNASWLLKSPRFMNNILEQYKDFILHDVMRVPKGAIYVSSKTTNSSDPFIKWASDFLRNSGCPLEPIEPGANRYLFQEVNEAELVERCVDVLKRKGNGINRQSGELSKAFRKVMTFMGLGRAKIVFSPEVVVAFVHKRNIYAPEAPLTRELLVKVLNVCQSHLEGADGERFSSLMQAAFETLPPGTARTLASNDIEDAIKKAKSIQKENKEFIVNPGSRGGTLDCSSGSTSKKKAIERTVTPDAIDLTNDDLDAGTECCSRTRSGGKQNHAPATLRDLERQIAQISSATDVTKGGKRRKRRGGGEDEDLSPIIPASYFGQDDAGTDSCLRPSSQLQCAQVDESLGGGSLLCDPGAARGIGLLQGSTKARICSLRAALEEALDLVLASIPSLGLLLKRVRHGYDSSNDTYEAFCDGTQIVVNLFAYLPKLPRAPSPGTAVPQKLIHDLAITVTHELAHFLEPREGHGPVWRDTHMRMVTEVMNYVSKCGGNGKEKNKPSHKRQRRD
uniref:Uncharacterized protein n=1 Tax=Odontella aurita TaxID=265563 RepID=A0A6U6CTT5_9STRA|mmetsp:Transcript_15882/g.45645  ORF Transcript_15882/g.45645 Transcript_15882/m.45645 type:complete len:1041 (+) Transcript_15882:516-3638(+)